MLFREAGCSQDHRSTNWSRCSIFESRRAEGSNGQPHKHTEESRVHHNFQHIIQVVLQNKPMSCISSSAEYFLPDGRYTCVVSRYITSSKCCWQSREVADVGVSELRCLLSTGDRGRVVMQLLLCHKGLGLSVLHLHHLHFTSGTSEVDYTTSLNQ
jgi:hypothetical protein